MSRFRLRHAALAAGVAVLLAATLAVLETTAGGVDETPGQTFLVSSFSNGAPIESPQAFSAPSMSGDGRFVVWATFVSCPIPFVAVQPSADGCGTLIQLKDRETGAQSTVADLAAGDSGSLPVISRDGCSIAFTTFITFDTTLDDGNNDVDIYVLDRCRAGQPVHLITRSAQTHSNPTLSRRPAISGNGRFVAFSFEPDPAGTPADIAIVDRDTDGNGNPFDTAPSQQVEVDSAGTVADRQGAIEPALSDDGGRLAFNSDYDQRTGVFIGPNTQVWMLDRNSDQVTPVSARGGVLGDHLSVDPAISGDGRVVAFVSQATNLSDIAVPACQGFSCVRRMHARDLGGEPELIARNESGAPSNQGDASPALSFDGVLVAFDHFGEDLVSPPNPDNFEGADIIVVNRLTRLPTRISVNPAGAPVTLANDGVAISSTGRFVAFESDVSEEVLAVDLGTNDSHVLVRDRPAGLAVTAVDFGSVNIDAGPAGGTATATNNGRSTFVVEGIGTSSGEFTVVGGSCVAGTRLAPTQSCTVDLVFDPASTGARTATLTITSAPGFDANPTATGALAGSGQPPPTVPPDTAPPDTAPPDTAPPDTDPPDTAPPDTAPPTVAPVTSLSITPDSATFPTTIIGVTSVAQAFVVRNTGNQPNTVAAPTLIGTNPGDYLITSTTCAGTLAPNVTCTVGVAFRPTTAGSRPASVRVTGSGGSSAVAALNASGSSAPTIVLSPAVARGGGVVVAIGGAFPPSLPLTLTLDGQAKPFTVTTDAAGGFRIAVVVRSGEAPGTHRLTATGQPGLFDTVSAPLLVVLGTYQPQTATGPAFGAPSILSRG